MFLCALFDDELLNQESSNPTGQHESLSYQKSTNCYFQQDNDPKHTANSIKAYLANYEVPTLPWPSQSPDLNPIENLWSILDDKVKDRNPQNEEQLFTVLQNAWNALEPELLTKLADSMPKRIAAVIEAKGFPTKY